MGKVIGIGGIFFKFQNPDAMREWYEKTLGMTGNNYGVLFKFNSGLADHHGYLQLGTFPENSDYFGRESQKAMINFRVDNLESLKKNLENLKVTICNEIEEYDYGKFLHIEDPDGNRIELWEPMDGAFSAEISQEML